MKFKIFVLLCLLACIAIALGWFRLSSSVSDYARIAAVTSLQDSLGRNLEKGTLIIVDFTQPSQSKRLSVTNIETGTILFYARVAHVFWGTLVQNVHNFLKVILRPGFPHETDLE